MLAHEALLCVCARVPLPLLGNDTFLFLLCGSCLTYQERTGDCYATLTSRILTKPQTGAVARVKGRYP
jgi:hypothetical protein